MNHRYSFIDLFSKKVDYDKTTQVTVSGIVLPQIQRPYAQGRTDSICTYVRNTFLDEIFDSLQKDDDEIFDLNFIYGIIKASNDNYKMELLDGQQRLTTLFLLYWYIANAELDGSEDLQVRECLSKFVYETRSTSTVFCQELAQYKVDFGEKMPKEVIRNAKWYFKSFDRDSTITAMLTMLDAIHKRYTESNRHDLYKRLQYLQFYVKSLGVFNLSEELYIKMNARGLQLSPFENFKADLTNFVSNNDYQDYQEQVPLYKKNSKEMVPFSFNFSVKLDAKWVDIFWKNGADDFDDAYMSFFSRFFACKYIISSKEDVSDKDMRSDKTIKFFYTNAEEQIGSNEYFGFKSFENLLKSHPEYIITLDKVLDVIYHYDYSSEGKVIFSNMLPVWEKNEELSGDNFYCNTSSKMSQVKLIALGAAIEFIEAMPNFEPDIFAKWMRIVWNVIENTNIDSLTPVSSLIRKFSAVIHFIADKKSEGVSFYAALSKWRDENSSERENRALLEEVEKARRIAENPNWEMVWVNVENHAYFKGMVTFFYSPEMTLEEYKNNANRAKTMFDKNGISDIYKKKHILIRAIVSQFNTWEDINELYITERAEKNKFLKNILASDDKVREMLHKVLYKNSIDEITDALQNYIDNAPEAEPWQNANDNDKLAYKMAIKRLRTDVNMYDWISAEEERLKATFRVYWYAGHIMFAVPRKQYAKIALDTERARMAHNLCDCYGFVFDDENQELMYKDYKDCFGNEIWLRQDHPKCTIWLGFKQYHEFVIHISCKTKKYATELLKAIEGASYIDGDETWVQLEDLTHYSYLRSNKRICDAVNELLEVIQKL